MEQVPDSVSQSKVATLLADPTAHASRPAEVVRLDTHGAMVFLAGDDVYKIKRAVKFSYMDFSTLERRHAAVLRELEVNRAAAPGIYLDAVPITCAADGRLQIGGDGEAVEWAVHMRRFSQADLASALVARAAFGGDLARATADAVIESHARAPRHPGNAFAIDAIVAELDRNLASVDLGHGTFRHEEFVALAGRQSRRCAEVLARRSAAGFVRRCHGDLHLDNIVLWHGRPTLFDAIEFNEQFAVIDTLYDLAFLLMDLDRVGARRAANVVLNRYLWRSQATADIEGLAALPLFLGVRGMVRGLVAAQRSMQETGEARIGDLGGARARLCDAMHYLQPPAPRLVAVGGLSGTGKTTLAAALAPDLGPAPGAVHLRTDLERKAMFGVGETERLPAEAYTAEAAARVYARVLDRARLALAAGHAVIVDAVFAGQHEREAMARSAAEAGVVFAGLWLEAPTEHLLTRVTARVGDASDADASVVKRQLSYPIGEMDWRRVDAGGSSGATLRAARQSLAS